MCYSICIRLFQWNTSYNSYFYFLQADVETTVPPKLVILTRSVDHGFGFTLRHFIVYPPESPSEVECLVGEETLFRDRQEPLDTIFVKHVQDGSPAYLAGLTTGDRILSVNEASIQNLTYQEIVFIIKSASPTLRLIVVPKENDILQQIFGSTAHNPESNLNLKPIYSPFYSGSHLGSTWSSISSLSSVYPMPSPAPYQPCHPKPLPLAPPSHQLRANSPSPTPQKQRKAVPYSGASTSPLLRSHAHAGSGSRSGGGRQSSVSSSHLPGRQQNDSATSKGSKKRPPPLVLDRKQAVYNIQNLLPFPLKRSTSDQVHNKSSETEIQDGSAGMICQMKSDASQRSRKVGNRSGIFEPVIVKEDIIQYGEPKRLEKDPDGRLYEVAKTRIVESNMSMCDHKDFTIEKTYSPLSKSLTEGNIRRKEDSDQYPSLGSCTPSKTAKLDNIAVDLRKHYSPLNLNRRYSEGHSNKENIEKSVIASTVYSPTRPLQEVIERIKKNVEQKEEFLNRPNEPLWKPERKDSGVLKEYFASPKKIKLPAWPPPETEAPPTPGGIMKALSFALNQRERGQVLKRTKSEMEGPRTVSFPSATVPKYLPIEEEGRLWVESRSNSLPNSPTSSFHGDTESMGLVPFPGPAVNASQSSSLPYFINPLVGNSVPKPYGKHLVEEVPQATKMPKQFVSTLSRIQENISATNKDLTPNDKTTDSSSLPTISITSTSDATPVKSTAANTILLLARTVPLAWVGDNERIKQFQIVSTRAKKFESPDTDREARRTAFHRFELSRLSQRADAFNVASRKKEFERRDSEVNNRDVPGLRVELGTSFNNVPPRPRTGISNYPWVGSSPLGSGGVRGGVMKSHSDGGSFFAVSKDFLSLPEESGSATITSAGSSLPQGSGNRMIPIGSTKIHCEPPESKATEEDRKMNESDIFSVERDRSNSMCASTTKWSTPHIIIDAARRKSSPAIRQHSFHTIQSQLALPGVPESDLAEASRNSTVTSVSYSGEGAEWPQPTGGSSAPHQTRLLRPTFLDIKQHARPTAEGGADPAHISSHSSCMTLCDQGAVSSLQRRIVASSEALTFAGSSNSSPSTPAAGTATAVTRRSKQSYGDDNDRLVRRVSYLKATSGERIYSDSEADSEDEKPSVPSPASIVRRAVGSLASADLPSPSSFQSSVTTAGALHVKLAKVHGKRAGDRSWKSVWAVLRGKALLLYKDRQQAAQTPLSPEDQVTLRGADVGVATDYTKRRHVFRLSTPTGSQFLLQAESDPSMTAWLTSLTAATAQDEDTSAGAPIAEPETLSPSFDSSALGSAATTPTTGPPLFGSSSDLIQNSSDTSTSPPTALKTVKKVTLPQKAKGFSVDQQPYLVSKTRKYTGELGSSPKSKTWKGRLGRHLRKMQAASTPHTSAVSLPEGASIGVCLEDCPPSVENEFVPMLVSLCIHVVESKGLHIQGIYRVPGNRAAVTHLTETVNRGPNAVDLSDPRWSDVNVISSLLKQFFRKLPDPLITSELYPLFIEASKIDDPQQRLIELKHLLQDLPDHHYETLRFLCSHLNKVIENSAYNKMDVRNLAIVFGPTLVRASDDNMAKMVTDMSHQCQIVEMLLSQFTWFFSDEESDEPPPIIPPSGNPLCTTAATEMTNASDLEFVSQSLLLNNVQKLEANHRDTKKLIVSSIISAANRRVQKARKKAEEENSSGSYDTSVQSGVETHNFSELASVANHRKVSNISITSRSSQPASLERLSGSKRDGRLFSDVSDSSSSFPSDEKLSLQSSLNSLHGQIAIMAMPDDRNINPAAVGCHGTLTAAAHNSPGKGSLATGYHSSLSRSEPCYVGNDSAIKSYTGLSAITQERIRLFEMETRAMLQRDSTRHRRELDKQRIEEEIQRAKKDMETEDIFDRMADNPSEVVRMITDYSWTPTRDTISLPSHRSSAPSAIKPCGLTNAPYSSVTNASTKDEKYNCQDLSSNEPRPSNEGSDLMRAITATFEEKMRLLQESHLLANERDDFSSDGPLEVRSSSPGNVIDYRRKDESRSGVSTTAGGSKCKLYRDPSLHRRRVTPVTAANRHSASDTITDSEFGGRDSACDDAWSANHSTKNEDMENTSKEKKEKRLREPQRFETPKGLREKKPRELKGSDTLESLSSVSFHQDSSLTPSMVMSAFPAHRREKRESGRYSAELRGCKHNVKELMEKFEQKSPVSPSVPSAVYNSSTGTTGGHDKPSKKQSRKSRIKRRHTVGGMKDLARVAWLKVIEAANYGDPQKISQDCQMPLQSSQLPSWEQLQLFLEALSEGRKITVDQQAVNSWAAREKLGNTATDLETILRLVLPPQQKETLKRRFSCREPSVKPLHPVLESNV